MKTLKLIFLLNLIPTLAFAAWYADRDNSMSPTHNIVGQNMVVISSKSGATIGTQVYCPKNPGTVLGVAHGMFDRLSRAAKQNRKYRAPADNFWGIATFPMKDQHYSEISDDSQFFSPLKDPKINMKNKPHLDYGFILPDKNLNPNSEGVRILNASSTELIKASNNNSLDVHLYRAETVYPQNSDGSPDFSQELTYQKMRDPHEVYIHPLRVNQECDLYVTTRIEETSTNCPAEGGVSGSPLVSEVNGKFYISGIITRGADFHFKKSDKTLSGTQIFLNSAQFCSDYESLCGVPCTGLDEVLQNRD